MVETYTHDFEGDIVAVAVAGEVIEATANHPFWVAEGDGLEGRDRPEHVPGNPDGYGGGGRWVDAIDLRVGDVLLLRSGEQAAITSLVIRHARLPVYNFHVEELHCYAVGYAQILVHNNSLDDAIARGMKVLRGKDAPDRMVEVMEKLSRPMSRERIREVIHRVKDKNGVGTTEDLVFDHSGGIWDSRTGDFIQKMWE